MPMISDPLKWYTVATMLEQAVFADLTTQPDRHGVVPGAIAWDECTCGLLAVSLARVFPSETFPDEATRTIGNCEAPYEVGEFVIQVIRCIPGADGQALAPTTAELDASAQEVDRDAYEMRKATRVKLCEMKGDGDISNYFVRPTTAQGPTGVCGGNELRAYVALFAE